MDFSVGPNPWGTSPPTDPAAYFTDSMALGCEIRDHGEAFLDKEAENNTHLHDCVVPLATQASKPAHLHQSCSTESMSICQLRRTRVKETDCYHELGRLGNGGNGNCFLLQRRPDNELRVCKVIHSTPKHKNQRPAEAEILQSILAPHERIVRMHELLVTPYTAEMYFDYYAGGDLDQLMNQAFEKGMLLEENFVWHCYRQLSEALAYIHTGYDALNKEYTAPPPWSKTWTPVIHGDVKPLNVFMKPSPDGSFPSLVLGDFGNSRLLPGRALLGTVPWMPPEIPEYSVQADVWGVGAIIHALCHDGRPPMRPFPSYWALTQANIKVWSFMSSARQCEPLGPEYSLNLNKILQMNMRWRPSDRPSSNKLLGWVNGEVWERHRLFSDWHTIGCETSARRILNPFILRSSAGSSAGWDDFSFAPSINYDPRYDRNIGQLFPANSPPSLEPDGKRPRYLGTLPDRKPYWLQDANGNWYTGDEPAQPDCNWDVNKIQPNDYVKDEPNHDVTWPAPWGGRMGVLCRA